MDILSIDIGGTKTATAVCHVSNGRIVSVQKEISWPSREHSSLDAIIAKWVDANPDTKLHGLGIGVPGPVNGGFLKQFGRATNLGWQLDSSHLKNLFGVPVYLCNDMESHGWGILGLQENDVIALNPGVPGPGSKALIAAGTGLGESIIAWSGSTHIPVGGEGGHSAFSPSTPMDDRLLAMLRTEYDGHVSWERVLGGRYGFRHLAMFTAQDRGIALPEALKKSTHGLDDWGAAIIQLAQSGDVFCNDILTWYAMLYGREASNLAVKCVAHSGVYIGGGIAPRILPWLKDHFMRGFTDKGRFAALLAEMPVYIIADSRNGLKGAALGAWHKIISQ